MPASLRDDRRWILAELERQSRPRLSESLKKYLGSPLPTLGVSAPDLHRVVREFRRRNGPRSSSQIGPLLRALWAGGTYEERILAIELLDRYSEAHKRDHLASRLGVGGRARPAGP